MFRRTTHRLTTALLVTLALLFSQGSLASYACPGERDTAAMAEMLTAGQPCDGMDAAQPALCHEHAAATAQSCEAGKLSAPSAPLIVQVLALPPVPDASAVVGQPVADARQGRPPPEPLFRSTLRLRV